MANVTGLRDSKSIVSKRYYFICSSSALNILNIIPYVSRIVPQRSVLHLRKIAAKYAVKLSEADMINLSRETEMSMCADQYANQRQSQADVSAIRID